MRDPIWALQLYRARKLLLAEGKLALEHHVLRTPPSHSCRMCFSCACLHVLVDDNEAMAGGPSW